MCWLSQNQLRPKKTWADFCAKKVIYAIAFDAYCPLAQVCVPKGETVNGKFYSEQVITAVERRYLERRPKIFKLELFSIRIKMRIE